MGFLDSLKRALGGTVADADRQRRLELAEAWGVGGDADDGADDGGPANPAKMAEPAHPSHYDEANWRRKLSHLFSERLPVDEAEYRAFLADAQALGLDRDWVERAQREEFELLIRRVVADGVVTMEEHARLDSAHRLIGMSDEDADAILHKVVAEAEAFFGKPIEGA